jgi:Rrf2 family iron-sulfur cluster assembly transcriptional regulator
MEISRRTDYGVRLILDLAGLPDGKRASTQEIAERQSIPAPFLAKIISQLSLSGLVNTHRGAGGGVMLARPAAEINLLQVIEALDGPLYLNRCVADQGLCPQDQACPVHRVWARAQENLVAALHSTTFDVLAGDAARGGVQQD